ncbi:MAG: transposase [Phycisphaerae bacterium]
MDDPYRMTCWKPFAWRREVPSRPVVLIVDGAPTHKVKIVEALQKENRSWLRLEILPAYSPELNATEKVMKDIKKDSERVASFFWPE